jgi:hypothetical protein
MDITINASMALTQQPFAANLTCSWHDASKSANQMHADSNMMHKSNTMSHTACNARSLAISSNTERALSSVIVCNFIHFLEG